MSDKAKWGYLAGMIDGEGFIQIAKGSKPAPNGSGYMTEAPRYNLVVSVTGTNENLMRWLLKHFGGSWSRDKSSNPNWRPRCSWRSTGMKNKEIVLLGTLPYLVIKREQAKLGLEFARMYGEVNPNRREELYLKMKELNRRGVLVTTNTPDCCESDAGPHKSMGWRHKPNHIEPVLKQMIESDLDRNTESAPVVTQTA